MHMSALVTATSYALEGDHERTQAYATLAVAEQLNAVLEELRTTNLLTYAAVVRDDTGAQAAEMAGRRLGLLAGADR